MVLLVNDRRLMGDHRNGRVGNVLAWSAVGLVVVLDVVLLGVTALGLVGSRSAEAAFGARTRCPVGLPTC